jgi:prevent-host-death family protein
MKKLSVAQAKAHFSELIEDARRGRRTVILRHNRPAAAVVPASDVTRVSPPVAMTMAEALAALEAFAHLGDPSVDSLAELKAGRR